MASNVNGKVGICYIVFFSAEYFADMLAFLPPHGKF